MNPLFLIPITILIFALRGRWIAWHCDTYQLKAIWFCWRTKQSATVLDEMLQLWPGSYMLLEIWRWDFARYIIHHDHLERMDVFIEEELARAELTMNIFDKEEEKEDNPPDHSNN